jgi:ATP-binding cassette subfamily B protein
MLSDLAGKLFGPRRAGLLFRLIRENAWRHRWGYALALALMALVAATSGAVALVMENVMDDVFVERRPGMVAVIAAWVLVIFLVRGGAAYGQTVLLGRIGNRVVARLQTRIHDHVLAQGMGFHARQGTGDLTTRITHNCIAARQALNLVATRLGTDLLSVVALVGVMLWQDLAMSLIALVGLPAVFGGVSMLVRRVRKLARDEVVLQGRAIGAMNETIRGARHAARAGQPADGGGGGGRGGGRHPLWRLAGDWRHHGGGNLLLVRHRAVPLRRSGAAAGAAWRSTSPASGGGRVHLWRPGHKD